MPFFISSTFFVLKTFFFNVYLFGERKIVGAWEGRDRENPKTLPKVSMKADIGLYLMNPEIMTCTEIEWKQK